MARSEPRPGAPGGRRTQRRSSLRSQSACRPMGSPIAAPTRVPLSPPVAGTHGSPVQRARKLVRLTGGSTFDLRPRPRPPPLTSTSAPDLAFFPNHLQVSETSEANTSELAVSVGGFVGGSGGPGLHVCQRGPHRGVVASGPASADRGRGSRRRLSRARVPALAIAPHSG